MTSPAETGATGDLAAFEDDLASGRAKTPLVVKLLVAATFVAILNETTMANAMPRLMEDFSIGERAGQWITTIFLLTMAAVIPVTGWFLQRVSTRTVYATAMSTFIVGTLIAAAAPTYELLLAARVVQASGTAVMMPLLMTTLMTVVAPADRGRVMGQVTLAMSCAPALGPAVSGVLLHLGSWRLIFIAMLPIAATVAFFGMRHLENVGEPREIPISWLSVVLAAGGFSTFVYGVSQVSTDDWQKPALLVGIGIALIAVFAILQVRLQKGAGPLLDLRALLHRNFTISLILMSAGFMAFLGALVLLPLYLQNLRGMSELEAGLLVMPGGLAMGLLGPQVGKVYDRIGARPLVIPGAIGMVTLLFALSRIGAETPYWIILVVHVALMASLSLIFTPVFTIGLGDLTPDLYSHGSSILGTLQQAAGAVGAALLIVVLDGRSKNLASAGSTDQEAFMGGLQWAFATGAVIGVVVVAMSLLLPNRVDAPEGAPPAGH